MTFVWFKIIFSSAPDQMFFSAGRKEKSDRFLGADVFTLISRVIVGPMWAPP